jgi:hypothetical protein
MQQTAEKSNSLVKITFVKAKKANNSAEKNVHNKLRRKLCMWWCYAKIIGRKKNEYAKQKSYTTLERNLQKISLRQKYYRNNKNKKYLGE